jgi:hypothetical protein
VIPALDEAWDRAYDFQARHEFCDTCDVPRPKGTAKTCGHPPNKPTWEEQPPCPRCGYHWSGIHTQSCAIFRGPNVYPCGCGPLVYCDTHR